MCVALILTYEHNERTRSSQGSRVADKWIGSTFGPIGYADLDEISAAAGIGDHALITGLINRANAKEKIVF